MTLEELVNKMPSFIVANYKRYYLFIAKGTRTKDHWVVGYSDYQDELTPPIEHESLYQALSMLLLEVS